jgi:hypothetical protein
MFFHKKMDIVFQSENQDWLPILPIIIADFWAKSSYFHPARSETNLCY